MVLSLSSSTAAKLYKTIYGVLVDCLGDGLEALLRFFIIIWRWNARFTRDALALSLFLFSSFSILDSPFGVGPRDESGSCLG